MERFPGYQESLSSTELHATCPFVLRQKNKRTESASQAFLQFHGTEHMISLLFKKYLFIIQRQKQISSTLSHNQLSTLSSQLTHILHSPLSSPLRSQNGVDPSRRLHSTRLSVPSTQAQVQMPSPSGNGTVRQNNQNRKQRN